MLVWKIPPQDVIIEHPSRAISAEARERVPLPVSGKQARLHANGDAFAIALDEQWDGDAIDLCEQRASEAIKSQKTS
jgi:hypothetical protein